MIEPPYAAPLGDLRNAAGVGILLGGVLLLGLLLTGSQTRAASSTAFALGALVMGFGLTTWATVVWIGDILESYFEMTDTTSRFTRADGVIAFSLITLLGAGTMLGATLVTVLLRMLGG